MAKAILSSLSLPGEDERCSNDPHFNRLALIDVQATSTTVVLARGSVASLATVHYPDIGNLATFDPTSPVACAETVPNTDTVRLLKTSDEITQVQWDPIAKAIYCVDTAGNLAIAKQSEDLSWHQQSWRSHRSVPQKGIAHVASDGSERVAVSTFFDKRIALLNSNGDLLRDIFTIDHPRGLTFIPQHFIPECGSNLLAVVDTGSVSVWDERQRAPVKRLQPGSERYSSITIGSSVLGVGGIDSTVFAVDPRKWSVSGSWHSFSKREVTALRLSAHDEERCYGMCGLDTGAVAGRWVGSSSSHNHAERGVVVRADGRFGGFDLASVTHEGEQHDVLAGITAANSLYVYFNAEHFVYLAQGIRGRENDDD